MSLRDKLKTSPKAEMEGIFLDLGEARIRLARAGGSNKKYAAALTKMYKLNQKAFEHDMISDARATELLLDVFVTTVVLGWETLDPKTGEFVDGVEGPDGKIVSATPENIKSILKDLPDLFTEIREVASNSQWYREKAAEDSVKNS